MFKKNVLGKFSDLPLRLVGAVIIGIFLLLPLSFNSLLVKIWFYALLLVCLYEISLNVFKSFTLFVISLIGGTFLFWLTNYQGGSGFFLASAFFLLLYFFSHLFLSVSYNFISASFFYTFYLITCFLSLISLFFLPQGRMLYLFLLLLVWVGDTAAYFIGLLFGKHKVAPKISPHKTWEGVIGGFIVSIFMGLILSLAFRLDAYFSLGAALIIGVASPLGDFIESSLKRSFNLKDTGFLFPGHGGALDRLDSLLFSALMFLFYLRFLGVWQ